MADNNADIMKRLKELEAKVEVFSRFVDDGGADEMFLATTQKQFESAKKKIKNNRAKEFSDIDDALDDLLAATGNEGVKRLISKVKGKLALHDKKIVDSIESIDASTVLNLGKEAKGVEKSVHQIMTTFSQMDALDSINRSLTTQGLEGVSKTIENNILNVKENLLKMKQETEEKFAEFPEEIRVGMVEPIEKELIGLEKVAQSISSATRKHGMEIQKSFIGTLESFRAGFSKFRTALSEIKIMEIADNIAEAGETFLALRRKMTKQFGLSNDEREFMRGAAREIQASVNYQISAADALETQVKIMETGVTDKKMAAAFAQAAEKVKITTGVDLSEMEDVLVVARNMGDTTGSTLEDIGDTLNSLKEANQMTNTSTTKIAAAINEASSGFQIASKGNVDVYKKMMAQLAASETVMTAQGLSEGTLSKVMGAIASQDINKIPEFARAGSIAMKERLDAGDVKGATKVYLENLDTFKDMLVRYPEMISEFGLNEKDIKALAKLNKDKALKDLEERDQTLAARLGSTDEHINEHSMTSFLTKIENYLGDNPFFLWMKDWDLAEDVTLKDIMKGISMLQLGVEGIMLLMEKDSIISFFTKGTGKKLFRAFSKGGFSGLFKQFGTSVLKPFSKFSSGILKGLGGGISKFLGPTITNLFKGIFDYAKTGFSGVFGYLKGMAKPLFGFFGDILKGFSKGFSAVVEMLGPKVGTAIELFSTKLLQLGEWLSGLGKWGTKIATGLGIGGKAAGTFGSVLLKVGGRLLGILDAIWDFFSGFFNSMETIGTDSIGGMLASGIGKLMGGGESGIGNAISNALKWGAAGTMVGGPVGAVVGGIGGLILGGIGGDTIGNFLYHNLSFESKDEEKNRLVHARQAKRLNERGTADTTPSYAGGLSEVPYDNYPALLHEGEAVLTARQAEVVRSDGGIPLLERLTGMFSPFRTAEASPQTNNLLNQIAMNTAANAVSTNDLKSIQEEYNEDSLELLENKGTGRINEQNLTLQDKQKMKMDKKTQERQQKSFFDKLKEGFQKGGVTGALGAIGQQAADFGRDLARRAFGGGAGKDVSALSGGHIAMAISEKTGLPAELIWAQLYHETGGFDSELATKYHNYGGVKGAGNEIGSDSRGHSYFASDQDFIDYYSDYILKYEEDGIGIRNAKTAAQWASVLKAGGYYTDSEANYAASMQEIIDAHADQMKDLQSGGIISKVAGTFQMAAQTLSNNCTVTAINAIEKFYTGVASAAEDGFSTAWGTLEGKLNATEYDFDVNEFPEFDKTLRNLLASGQERPMAFYMTGGAGDEGNHILNAHSGNHMVVITRMMPDGTFEVQDPQDGSTQYLRSDQIFDATARGGTQGMEAGAGNALFVPNVYSAALGEWEVPEDGLLYQLHAGEMVAPPELAEHIRSMLQGEIEGSYNPFDEAIGAMKSGGFISEDFHVSDINDIVRNFSRSEAMGLADALQGRASELGRDLDEDEIMYEKWRYAEKQGKATEQQMTAAYLMINASETFLEGTTRQEEAVEEMEDAAEELQEASYQEAPVPPAPQLPVQNPQRNMTNPAINPMLTAGGGFGGGLAQNRNLPSNDILQRLMNPNGGFMGRGGAGSIMDILRTPGIFGGGGTFGGGLPGIIGTIFGQTGLGRTGWGGALQSVLQNIFGGGNVQNMITGVLGNFNTGRYSSLIGTGIGALGDLIGGYFERGRKKKEAEALENAKIKETAEKETQLANAAVTESKQEAKDIVKPVGEQVKAEAAAMAEQKAAEATQQTQTNINNIAPPSPAAQQVQTQSELGANASVVDAIKWAVGRMEAKTDQLISAVGASGGTTNNVYGEGSHVVSDGMRVLQAAFRF